MAEKNPQPESHLVPLGPLAPGQRWSLAGKLESTEGKATRVIDSKGSLDTFESVATRALSAYAERPAIRAPASYRRSQAKPSSRILSSNHLGLLPPLSGGD